MPLSDKRLLNYAQRLRRLRHLAIGLLLFLLIPMSALLYFGFQQIENNLLIEYQREARNMVQTVNRSLLKKRMLTNPLAIDAFDYYQQVYNPITRQSQQALSPLSQLNFVQPKISGQVKGLVGFFQYNSQGDFNSPIWPYALPNNHLTEVNTDKANQQGLDQKPTPELIVRKETALKIKQILSQSKSI